MVELLIKPIFEKALVSLELGEYCNILSFEQPKIASHGDSSTNIAMSLTRILKKAPRVIAEEIISKLQYDNNLITSIEIAGAGFINIRLGNDFYKAVLEKIEKEKQSYGRLTLGSGKKVNVEYVSANPTGILHLGHGRNACIGDAVANLYDWAGYEVTREYYFNNAGNQMNMLGLSVHARYCQTFNAEYPFPENGYHGEYIKEIAQSLADEFASKLLEENEANLKICKEKGEEWCNATIRDTMVRLGLHHDVYFNEQTLYNDGSINKLVERLREKELVYDSEGAVWFAFKKINEKLEDRVIIKSSGEPTYRLPDIAYHINKLERGFDTVVDVFGVDHIATVPDIIAAVKALGYDESKVKVLLYQFVTLMENGEQVKMSKRTGKSYTLDELIDDVGIDVVRFFFIMRSINTHLDFDLALAKEQSDKNPVLYIQYAHARICRIFETAKERELLSDEKGDFSLLTDEHERKLIRTLARFEEHILRSLHSLEPYIIAEYLRDVATDFHLFYHHCPVLRSEKEIMNARLELCTSTRIVLKNGLDILGISAPEIM